MFNSHHLCASLTPKTGNEAPVNFSMPRKATYTESKLSVSKTARIRRSTNSFCPESASRLIAPSSKSWLWDTMSIVASAKERQNLEILASTDIMTGILNRGSGERKVIDAMANDKTGMLCILDVDRFPPTTV